ncbi:hypothetical protein HQN89_32540 [Paenibacillus frigoriresistens]|uniref:hypothetical protein n=1 Tax=Paenibacillus alginolyticus TaxID=59839 RepID=UPI0015654CAD|nr:hypothetical protein [Paenibacillus frigoriresistens]NRF95568.1 hypothetical protein [Paenibacillus frigoriresistens]
MKKAKRIFINAVLAGAIVITTVPLSVAPAFAKTSIEQGDTASLVENQTTKYPIDVMKVIRKSLGGKANSSELDNQINNMTKIEVMDRYFYSSQKTWKGEGIRKSIDKIFKINLDTLSANGEGSVLKSYSNDIMEGVRKNLKIDPASTQLDKEIMAMPKAEVMDRFLKSYSGKISSLEIRTVVNEIFGVNLVGISSLDKARLSLFSKGQWMSKNDSDIFAVVVEKGDMDLRVEATPYFIKKIGTSKLPDELDVFLKNLGFTLDTETNVYKYSSQTGESVPDSFKTKLIGTLIKSIHDNYYTL